MELVNETPFQAGWTLGFARDGRELLILVVKGTFAFPEGEEMPPLADEQLSLVEADRFTGEPGFSAVLEEVDYAHYKPACDVLLNGSARAPGGRPVERVTVSLQVGSSVAKSFDVVGNRQLHRTVLQGHRATAPEACLAMPITYYHAFGGVDRDASRPEKVATYGKNPVGVGYYPLAHDENLEGRPLPNTEESGRSVSSRNGSYEPMSFGPVGRNFASRYPLAGTYDQQWLNSRAPFWPDDFDYAYFQSAPRDQQMPYPHGGERVILRNLTPTGLTSWQLPVTPMPFAIIRRNEVPEVREAVIDTILIDSDAGRFSMTWRTAIALKRDCFAIAQVNAGRASIRPPEPSPTTPRFRSISEFIAWKKRRV